MDKSWIKLFRKITNHPVFDDEKAFRVFLWILLNVNKETGDITVGRFWLASALKYKADTLYKVIKRLKIQYQLIDTLSNNKSTTIRVLNWAKYQQASDPVTTKTENSNNKVTHNKNIEREYINIYSDKKKNTYIFQGKEYDLKEYHVYQIEKPSCTLPPVKKGMKQKDYLAALSPSQLWEYAEMYGGRA